MIVFGPFVPKNVPH